MHLLLVRHGQSENNLLEATHGAGAAFYCKRSVDPPLSKLGRRQAWLLGKRFGAQLKGSKQRVRLLCSSMARAMQTAQPLAQTLGLSVLVHPDIHEVKGFFGNEQALGLGRAQIQEQYPGFVANLVPEKGQGSETCAEACIRANRVIQLLREWARGSEEDVIVIVSHNDFLGLLGRLLLVPCGGAGDNVAMEAEQMFHDSYWPMNNTGISHFILGVRPPAGAYQVDTYLRGILGQQDCTRQHLIWSQLRTPYNTEYFCEVTYRDIGEEFEFLCPPSVNSRRLI
ncbi:unnamed protein product [Durusdinium trenchii]|uniref:Uncharacterized protein n=1 Tax=Durusdinium trenchii TaxID=1381693 RepID=A0ABP0JKC3_9DINO